MTAATSPRPDPRAARAFQVEVAALLRLPGSNRRVTASAPMWGLSVPSAAVPDGAEVEISALLESVSEGILVTGTVTAPWTGICRRCLEEANGTFAAEVCELFSDDGDDDAYPLGGEVLDLAPLVRDACILELPLAPLCAEDCKGLCPQCGANRNLDPCSCEPPGDPRWGALAALSEQAEVDEDKDA